MPENAKLKRPASHRWTIGITAFMTIGFVLFLINIIMGRSGATSTIRQYWPVMAFLSFCALALLSLLFGGRQKWAYYVTSAFLAIWAFRGVYTSFLYAYYFIFTTSPLNTPYFHLAEQNQPFVVQQHVSGVKQIMVAVAAGLLIWLFLRFAIGRQSRSYYQFPVLENVKADKSDATNLLPD
ncbi:MAG: hypothetical protein JWQ71_2581 [Pedosphaera sp.]|nr:hypothetical protein [Pedosphaera sp.]